MRTVLQNLNDILDIIEPNFEILDVGISDKRIDVSVVENQPFEYETEEKIKALTFVDDFHFYDNNFMIRVK